MTPLKDTPRADREKALDTARASMLERYFRLSEELAELKVAIRQIDSQKLVIQGLELPAKAEAG